MTESHKQNWEEAWRSVSGKLAEYRYAAIDLEVALTDAGEKIQRPGFDEQLLCCIRHATEKILRLEAENARLRRPKLEGQTV